MEKNRTELKVWREIVTYTLDDRSLIFTYSLQKCILYILNESNKTLVHLFYPSIFGCQRLQDTDTKYTQAKTLLIKNLK